MKKSINLKSEVQSLYRKYYKELINLYPIQKSRYSELNAMYDDIESEILYMFVRDYLPNHIIEFSPKFGWSTSWMLEALNQNQKGKCVSYDLNDSSVDKLGNMLDVSRWSFIHGDVQSYYKNFDFNSIDFIFIDSDHSVEFTKNYIKNVIIPAHNICKKNLKSIPVFIHDIYGKFKSSVDEGALIKDFIKEWNFDYFTPSILHEDRKEIDSLRNSLNLSSNIIHKSKVNPVVIFKIGFSQ